MSLHSNLHRLHQTTKGLCYEGKHSPFDISSMVHDIKIKCCSFTFYEIRKVDIGEVKKFTQLMSHVLATNARQGRFLLQVCSCCKKRKEKIETSLQHFSLYMFCSQFLQNCINLCIYVIISNTLIISLSSYIFLCSFK